MVENPGTRSGWINYKINKLIMSRNKNNNFIQTPRFEDGDNVDFFLKNLTRLQI